MRSIFRAAAPARRRRTRMIWLPGAYHAAQDFLDGRLRGGGAPAASAPRSALRRSGIRAPGRSQPRCSSCGPRSCCRRATAGVSVWLAGISLGGLIALDYAASYPDELDGLCLLAPYLGNRMLTAEIAARARARRAGSRANLRKPTQNAEYGAISKRGAPTRGRCTWASGSDDRFAAAHELLAATLPADSVDVDRRRPRVAHLGSSFGRIFWIRTSHEPDTAPRQPALRWAPSPLLYASAAVHLGAAAAVLARPRAWPWALGAVALPIMWSWPRAGLWPRSQLLGPNWTRLPAQAAHAGGRHHHRRWAGS